MALELKYIAVNLSLEGCDYVLEIITDNASQKFYLNWEVWKSRLMPDLDYKCASFQMKSAAGESILAQWIGSIQVRNTCKCQDYFKFASIYISRENET